MLEFRPYQRDCNDAMLGALGEKRFTLGCIPTGGGKTACIARLMQGFGRVLEVSHRAELCQQTLEACPVWAPGLDVGVYSAGMNAKETRKQATIATIGSVFDKAHMFPPIDLLIVDEVHMVKRNDEGQYRRLLHDLTTINPKCLLAGYTATPYRLDGGLIYGGKRLFPQLDFSVSVSSLIEQGYLCPLTTHESEFAYDATNLRIRGGEFVPSELEGLVADASQEGRRVADILVRTERRRSVLVFAATVRQAERVAEKLGQAVGVAQAVAIHGETPPLMRQSAIEAFKAGELRYLVNVECFTTGFDARRVDAVALMRPTQSAGLYYQMCGRGFRTHEDKQNCLILDYGGNIQRHGPVDNLDPHFTHRDGVRVVSVGKSMEEKECPDCGCWSAVGARECPDCDHLFTRIDAQAAGGSVVGKPSKTRIEVDVQSVDAWAHEKKDAPPGAPRTLRVVYLISNPHKPKQRSVSEFWCVEHANPWLRDKAKVWWRRRTKAPFPDVPTDAEIEGGEPYGAEIAADVVNSPGFAKTYKITLEYTDGKEWPEIVGHVTGPVAIPDTPIHRGSAWEEEERIPF